MAAIFVQGGDELTLFALTMPRNNNCLNIYFHRTSNNSSYHINKGWHEARIMYRPRLLRCIYMSPHWPTLPNLWVNCKPSVQYYWLPGSISPQAQLHGLVQVRCKSSALAMELRLCCTNPSIRFSSITWNTGTPHWWQGGGLITTARPCIKYKHQFLCVQ